MTDAEMPLAIPVSQSSLSKARATICIPAYKAAGFIAKTLNFAGQQTFEDIRILVSVDGKTDGTYDICETLAATDKRIEVIQQPVQQGWAANTNALLEQVDTEFFCIYFHDDILHPNFIAKLVTALLQHPAAASANCSMQNYGNRDNRVQAVDMPGNMLERLVQIWTRGSRGALLRSLIRSDRIDEHFRVNVDPDLKIHRPDAFATRMVAAGPAIAVNEVLYTKWVRDEGLIAGWTGSSFDDVLAGWRTSIDDTLNVINENLQEQPDAAIARFVFLTYAQIALIAAANRNSVELPVPRRIHESLIGLKVPDGFLAFDDKLRRRVLKDWRQVRQHRRKQNAGPSRRFQSLGE